MRVCAALLAALGALQLVAAADASVRRSVSQRGRRSSTPPQRKKNNSLDKRREQRRLAIFNAEKPSGNSMSIAVTTGGGGGGGGGGMTTAVRGTPGPAVPYRPARIGTGANRYDEQVDDSGAAAMDTGAPGPDLTAQRQYTGQARRAGMIGTGVLARNLQFTGENRFGADSPRRRDSMRRPTVRAPSPKECSGSSGSSQSSADEKDVKLVDGPPLNSYKDLPVIFVKQLNNPKSFLGGGTDGDIYRIVDTKGSVFALKRVLHTKEEDVKAEEKATLGVFMDVEKKEYMFAKLKITVNLPITIADLKQAILQRQRELDVPPFELNSERAIVVPDASITPKSTQKKMSLSDTRKVGNYADDLVSQFCGDGALYFRAKPKSSLLIRTKFEIDLMQMLSGQYTMKVFRVYRDKYGFDYIMHVADYGDGEDVIQKARRLYRGYEGADRDLEFAVKLAAFDVVRGLEELHKLKVAHHDLKWENTLSFRDRFRVADFGMSQQLVGDYVTHVRGTIKTLPPEIFSQPPKYQLNSDLWSLGIMIYEAIFGENPFHSDPDVTESKRTRSYISNMKKFSESYEIPENVVSKEAVSFLRSSICKLEHRFANVEAAKQHEWFDDVRYLKLTRKASPWVDANDKKMTPQLASEHIQKWREENAANAEKAKRAEAAAAAQAA